MGMENDAVRWGYETLDIYITKDGIDEICFANQYDIGSPDTNKMELLPFSDIMAVFDKMMQVQNAALIYRIKVLTKGIMARLPKQ